MAQQKKKSATSPSKKSEETISSDSAFPFLDPHFSPLQFNSFDDMAKGFDALINEFYRHYRQLSQGDPNMFGFVSVSHEVRFENIERMRTENLVGQKMTLIYAPVIQGEGPDERRNRELNILAAFDPTKRPSHIMALSLLMTLLGKKGVNRLVQRHTERKTS
jgi:hypothetical protein